MVAIRVVTVKLERGAVVMVVVGVEAGEEEWEEREGSCVGVTIQQMMMRMGL